MAEFAIACITGVALFVGIVVYISFSTPTKKHPPQTSDHQQIPLEIVTNEQTKINVGGHIFFTGTAPSPSGNVMSKQHKAVVQKNTPISITFADGDTISKLADDTDATKLHVVHKAAYFDTEKLHSFNIRYLNVPPEDIIWYVINKGTDHNEYRVNDTDEYGNNKPKKSDAFLGQTWIAKNAFTGAEIGRIKLRSLDLPVIVIQRDEPLKVSAV